MKRTLLLIASLLYTTSALAQRIGNCEPALAEAYLDVNNVRARIPNTGGLFWNGSPHVYEVPRFGGTSAIFASSLWVGGRVDGALHFAGSTYGPWEFWPGPLDAASNPPADCSTYDHIYNIYQRDIDAYEQSGTTTPDLLNWPWALGAPVVDGDGNPNNYNLAGGDRPQIRGHQTLWWVMNDLGNAHERTGSNPLGLEVQVTAYAAASDDRHINHATLYNYKLIYRGSKSLDSTFVGFVVDADLGNFDDDYVGSDSTLGMGYIYNADNDDEGSEGYGTAPPAIGYDLLQGPIADPDGIDNDRDGATDEAGERLLLTHAIHFNGGGGVAGDPETGEDMYNYLQARWKDNQPFTFGGNARDFSTTPVRYVFPGDPVTGTGWSELNPAADGSQPPIQPADRRFVISAGPFTFQPGDEEEITIAVVWARGRDNLDAVNELRNASATVQAAFEAGYHFEMPDPASLQTVQLAAPANGANEQPLDPTFYWDAIDSLDYYQIQLSSTQAFTPPDSTNPDNFFRSDVVSVGTYRFSYPTVPYTRYYWRVRLLRNGAFGPWSDAWQFTTSDATVGAEIFSTLGFLAVQNAAGPIDPPDMAAFAFNNSGFPWVEGNYTPSGFSPSPDRPVRGYQQFTNNSAWGIHAGGTESSRFDDDNGQSFMELVFSDTSSFRPPHSYEWRFPQHCLDQMDGILSQEDCLAYRAFDDSTVFEVPFELWSLGETVDDTADDFRMIPFVCEEACGAGTGSNVFDIAGDHVISGGDNDPYTDWVYWHNPPNNDAAPGEQGYLDFFFNDAEAGDEIFARMVLVEWNGGDMPPFEAALPEPGTIFRIANRRRAGPLLSAPANNEIRDTGTSALYWNAPAARFQVQIDTAPDFSAPLIDENNLRDSYFITEDLPKNGNYYWRVRMFSPSGPQASDWSDTWSFTIPLNVGIEESNPLATFSLAQSYPNPFNNTTRITYTLPEAAPVQLVVYDTLGRRVRVLVDATQPAGRHEAVFEASDLSNGTYFYRISAGDFTHTKTMTLIR